MSFIFLQNSGIIFHAESLFLGFKNLEEEDKENCSCGDELRERLAGFHDSLMGKVSLNALQEGQGDEVV